MACSLVGKRRLSLDDLVWKLPQGSIRQLGFGQFGDPSAAEKLLPGCEKVGIVRREVNQIAQKEVARNRVRVHIQDFMGQDLNV